MILLYPILTQPILFYSPQSVEPVDPTVTTIEQNEPDYGLYLLELEAVTGSTAVNTYYTPPILTVPILKVWFDYLAVETVEILSSDRDWTTRPDDYLRPNEVFEGRLSDPSLSWQLPLIPDGSSGIVAATAEFRLNNRDGQYDSTIDQLSFDGQTAVLKRLPNEASEYQSAVTVLNGISASVWVDSDNFYVSVRDRFYLLDIPLTQLYSGLGGQDGGAQVAGTPKPALFGYTRGVSPILIDPVKLIYQVHFREVQSIDAVYEGASSINIGASRASYALLESTTPTAATWDYYNGADGTYFRLGSNPTKPITADVAGDARGGYAEYPADILRRIILLGLTESDLNEASFDDLAESMPYVAGAYITEPTTISAVAARFASGCLLWVGDTGTGLITVGYLSAPATTDNYTAIDDLLITGEVTSQRLPEAIDPGMWRVTLGYRRNWTTLSVANIADISVIGADRWDEVQQPGRSISDSDPERQTFHPQARELVIDTFFDLETDAQSIASRLLELYRTSEQAVDGSIIPTRRIVTIPMGSAGLSIDLGSVVRLTDWPRLSVKNTPLIVFGKQIEGSRVALTCYG